jgi:8-oxo-dGTP pyrophosphatase MutT (NUDIX family)
VRFPERKSSRVAGEFGLFRVSEHTLDTGRVGFTVDVPDWVATVARTPDGRFVLVRQYRHGVDGLTLEIAGGLVDPGEDPTEAAARELLEETGYRIDAARVRPLGPSAFPAPGVIGERHFFFEAEIDPAAREEATSDGSAIERAGRTVILPLAEALEMARRGELEDEKTELALRRLAERVG